MLGLNMYELLPFWYTLFKELGFGIEISPPSSKAIYHKGQGTIPSDTVCYPAKLMHGHLMALKEKGIKTIFHPCLSYNVNEHRSNDHYNCPIVAYYPEVLKTTLDEDVRFLYPYFGLHRPKDFEKHFYEF